MSIPEYIAFNDVVKNHPVFQFMEKMAPGSMEAYARVEPLRFMTMDIKGAAEQSVRYLLSKYPSWADHPALSAIAGYATDRGERWLSAVLDSSSTGAVQYGDELLFGNITTTTNAGLRPYDYNDKLSINATEIKGAIPYAPNLWPNYVAGSGSTNLIARRDAMLAIGPSTLFHAQRVVTDITDATDAVSMGLKSIVDAVVSVLNVPYCGRYYATNDGSYDGDTAQDSRFAAMVNCRHGWRPLILASSSSYICVITYIPDDGSGTYPSIVGVNGSTTAMKGLIVQDPRYSAQGHLYGSNTTQSAPAVNKMRSNYFKDYADAYLEVMGMRLEDIHASVTFAPLASSSTWIPFSDVTLSAFKKGFDVGFLPVIGPLGRSEFSYFLTQVDTTHVELQKSLLDNNDGVGPDELPPAEGDPDGEPIDLINGVGVIDFKVEAHAARMALGLSLDWYREYLESGYGLLKKGSADQLKGAEEALAEFPGVVFTYVCYDHSWLLPSNIVERLEIYRRYKKAREKACLSNDFMSLKFNKTKTWGEAQTIVNGSRSVTVLYGYKDVLGATIDLGLTVPSTTTVAFSLAGGTGSGTTLNRSEAGVITIVGKDKADEVFRDFAYGATLSGITKANLYLAWGFSESTVTAEINDMVADHNALVKKSGKASTGIGVTPLRFNADNISISGYPFYESLATDDAYKAGLVSKAHFGKTTEGLRMAYLSMGLSLSKEVLGLL